MFDCPKCGEKMKEEFTFFTDKIMGESIDFKTEGYICICGYKTISVSQMREYDKALMEAYKKRRKIK